jgi:hypothetical protein
LIIHLLAHVLVNLLLYFWRSNSVFNRTEYFVKNVLRAVERGLAVWAVVLLYPQSFNAAYATTKWAAEYAEEYEQDKL